jgi:hypothetical protein
MAKRAIDGFVVALKDGKRRYDKDQIVPADVAKHPGVALNVYDDGAPAKPAKP